MMAIALGVVPGGVILKRFIGPMKNMIKGITRRAVQYLTRLAMNHSGMMKILSGAGAAGGAIARGGGRAIGWVGKAIQRAARKAKRFITGKCGCFTAATLVMTANGAVPIVDIEEGQQVLAAPDDGLSGSYSSNTVGTKIVVGEANLVQLIILHEDGSSEVINTTDEHPIHVADTAEWTRADGLVIGDHLSTIAGTSELVGVVYTTDRVPVYNLSIPGTPTYYVGEHGVWVHNASCLWSALDPGHVMAPKHNWSRIGVTDFQHAKSIMEMAMQFGAEYASYPTMKRGVVTGVKKQVEYFYKGEYVSVTYSIIDGVKRVTNGWVR
jgi:hypothetical protein